MLENVFHMHMNIKYQINMGNGYLLYQINIIYEYYCTFIAYVDDSYKILMFLLDLFQYKYNINKNQ